MSDAPDISLGCPHPRENYNFYGNEEAEIELYNAISNNHLHHAWIFCGPKNIGKATLAYRFARYYLGAKATGKTPLDCFEDDIISKQIENDSCPDLKTATRYCPDDEKVKTIISVFAIRELISMFDLRANNKNGKRIAIIDCADEMNDASANALLKTLEEPPKGAIIILIVNSLGAILPTIRSRCRILNLKPLSDLEFKKHLSNIDLTNKILSKNNYGRALILKNFEIDANYKILSRIFGMMPNPDMNDIISLTKMVSNFDTFEILMQTFENWFSRAASASINIEIDEIEPGESVNMARIIANLGHENLHNILEKINIARAQVANHLDKSMAIKDLIFFIKNQFGK